MANLAAKYRPKTFEDITEQTVIVGIVKNLCESETLSNRNFLFTGPAGCGKTTLARIIGTMLNGGSENIIEIDAASHSGVDAMREIIEQARQYPVGSPYKCFIIDEVHSISQAAWASMLKTLEEQPAKSVFLLCLTGDGVVFTSKGMKKLKEVTSDDLVWDGLEFRRVLNFFDNGTRECLTITLQNGVSITCTPNHNIQVLRGDQIVWSRADALVEGDHLLLCDNYRNVSAMEEISVEEAWMLGYITGNGNYTSHSLDLYTPFHKWDKVKWYLDKLVDQGVFKDYIVDGDTRAIDNHIHDTRIHFHSDKYHPAMTQWYEKTGLAPNYTRGTKKLPESVFRFNEVLIRSFVEGWYFADGSGSDESFFSDVPMSNPFLYCSNYSMIKDLQSLLLSIGVHSSIRKSTTVVTEETYKESQFIKPGEYTSYLIYVLRKPGYFNDCTLRNILIDKYRKMPKGRYKLKLSQLAVDGSNYRISPTMLSEAGYDFSDRGKFVEIVSIENAGNHHVYDIEVEGSHQFVYNGCIVHNCTTNPEKIPDTIISRVQTFQLSKISLDGIHNRLKHIIEKENEEGRGITYDDDAILYIAKLANGGLRDAITLLDKSLAYSTNLNLQVLQESLGLPNYNDYFDLLNALAKRNNEKIVQIVNSVYNSGVNFVKWFEGFFAFITNIVKYIYLQDINQTMIPSTYKDKISGYSTAHASLCLKLSNVLVKMLQELKGTQYLQELAISYLCDPKGGK